MKVKFSLIISISIHLIFIILILLYSPVIEEAPVENKIRIELVTKIEKKIVKRDDIKENKVDIIKGQLDIQTSISKPASSSYLDDFLQAEPDLILQNRSDNKNEPTDSSDFDIGDFEDSLLDLMPIEEFIENSEEDDVAIEWDDNRRVIKKNSSINFSLFPKESFTGVGVSVEFMVNTAGEVFGVNVLPPGSGSIDFDILIKQYVTKFVFNKSETNSKGEIFIVYKK